MSLILKEVENSICALTFNRPESLNAFTPDLLRELVDAVKAAEADEDVRVLVLEGAGRAFSAGVDLKALQDIEPQAGDVGNSFDTIASSAAECIRKSCLPVIAKVHGFCFTGALELALHCDFIFTSVDAKFGDTHATWGLRPSWGMSQNLARAVGVRKARELSFSARTFSGEEAARLGLANAATADKQALDAHVQDCANAIAAGSSGSISAYKKLYRVHEEMLPLEQALQTEIDMQFPEITDTVERLKRFGK